MRPLKACAFLFLSGCFQAANIDWASADGPENQAGSESKVGISFRYRLEQVEQAGFDRDALASTLRGRLNFLTGSLGGFSAFVELDYVAQVGSDRYNAGGGNTPDRAQYPLVADPKGEDLNQAFLQYQADRWKTRLGRQRIIINNARFIGNVGWRQNEQTYDAWSVEGSATGGIDYSLAYVGKVHRIFGNDVPAGDQKHETYLLNATRQFDRVGKLAVYWFDIDNEDDPSVSNRTWGLRLTGQKELERSNFTYALEYARQAETGDNPVPYDADYYRLDLSWGPEYAQVFAGFESLGGQEGNPGQAFGTPLATLHAFNGWADRFSTTPEAGLEDLFVGVKGPWNQWSWYVAYHDFAAESGAAGYGSEIDVSFSRRFADHYGVLLKFADFKGASAAYADTTKLWLQLTADF